MAHIQYGDLYCFAIDFLLLNQTPYDVDLIEKVGLIRLHLIEPGNQLKDRPWVFEWLQYLVTIYKDTLLGRELRKFREESSQTARKVKLLAGASRAAISNLFPILSSEAQVLFSPTTLIKDPSADAEYFDRKRTYKCFVVLLYKYAFCMLFWPTIRPWLVRDEKPQGLIAKNVMTELFFSEYNSVTGTQVPLDEAVVTHVSSICETDDIKERLMIDTILDYFRVALDITDIWRMDDTAPEVGELSAEEMKRLTDYTHDLLISSDKLLSGLRRGKVLQSQPSYFTPTDQWTFVARNIEGGQVIQDESFRPVFHSIVDELVRQIARPVEEQSQLMKTCIRVFKAGFKRFGSGDKPQSFPETSPTVSFAYSDANKE